MFAFSSRTLTAVGFHPVLHSNISFGLYPSSYSINRRLTSSLLVSSLPFDSFVGLLGSDMPSLASDMLALLPFWLLPLC